MADWPPIIVRFALYLTLGALFGLAAFSLYGVCSSERTIALPLRPWLVAGATLGLLLSVVALVVLAAAMTDVPVWPPDYTAISALLDEPSIGTAWKVRVVALILAGAAAMSSVGRTLETSMVLLTAGTALATLAWTGHGTMGDGLVGVTHLAADILHLLAAGAWVGALLGLTLLVARPVSRVDGVHLDITHRALHRFATAGSVVVATVVVTGAVNAWLLVGTENIAGLWASLYGQLLIAKLVLMMAMLGLASLNRFRLTPALAASIPTEDSDRVLQALRISLAAETTCVVLILALVGWLGTLEPPTSVAQLADEWMTGLKCAFQARSV